MDLYIQHYLLGILIIDFLYILGRLILSFWFNTLDQHVFLGFGRKLFGFRIAGLIVSVGFFIPFPWLSRIYAVIDGEKKKLGYPWEFYDVSVGKRLLASFGGIFAMVFSAIVIFTIVAYNTVDTYVSKEEVNKHGIYPGWVGKEVGFEPGDQIIAVNGNDFERFSDLFASEILLSDSGNYTVQRADSIFKLYLPPTFLDLYSLDQSNFVNINYPFEIGFLLEGGTAEQGGMIGGDKILAINDSAVSGFYDCIDMLSFYAGDSVTIKLMRGDQVIDKFFAVGEDGKLGFSAAPDLVYTSQETTLPEAVVAGFSQPFELVAANVKALGKMFKGDVTPSRSISGPVGIAKIYGQYSFKRFWRITGLLMMVTVLWNILPLPNSVFMQLIPIVKEGITGRPMSLEAFKKLNWIPYTIIGLMMAFAIFSDIMMAMSY